MDISKKITDILKDYRSSNPNLSLDEISRISSLPIGVLEDMCDGAYGNPSLEHILNLSDCVEDTGACYEILSHLWPSQAKRFEYLRNEEFRLSDVDLSELLRDKENWLIVTLASRRSGGTSLKEIEELLPISGAHKVSNLLDKGILQVVKNRLQAPDICVQNTGSLLNQIANMTLLFKQGHLGGYTPNASTLLAYSEGLNDQGIEAAYQAIVRFNDELETIRKNPAMIGDRSFFLGLVSDELKGVYE